MNKRCADCVNYQRVEDAERFGRPIGECRIGPPQPTASVTDTRWPLVFADEWCGCFIERDPAPATLPFPAEKAGPRPGDVARRAAEAIRDALAADGSSWRPPPEPPDDRPDVLPFPGTRTRPPGGGAK